MPDYKTRATCVQAKILTTPSPMLDPPYLEAWPHVLKALAEILEGVSPALARGEEKDLLEESTKGFSGAVPCLRSCRLECVGWCLVHVWAPDLWLCWGDARVCCCTYSSLCRCVDGFIGCQAFFRQALGAGPMCGCREPPRCVSFPSC